MLPLQRYRFDFRVETPLQLNDYAGSMLRGLLGWALRRASCLTRAESCHNCLLRSHCPYPTLFEPLPPSAMAGSRFHQIPPPYVIEPPPLAESQTTYAKGELFSFHFVLFGQAANHQLSILLFAWQQALKERVGKSHAALTLEQLWAEPQAGAEPTLLYDRQQGQHLQPFTLTAPARPTTTPTQVVIELLTPLRIQRQNRPLGQQELNATELLMALIRRVTLLEEALGEGYQPPDFAALQQQSEAIEWRSDLRWRDLFRYSNRQRRKIPLGGLMGTLELSGDLAPFIEALVVGQWCHIGSNTPFGLGGYRLVGLEDGATGSE